jgi:hypothetical protein
MLASGKQAFESEYACHIGGCDAHETDIPYCLVDVEIRSTSTGLELPSVIVERPVNRRPVGEARSGRGAEARGETRPRVSIVSSCLQACSMSLERTLL